MAAADCTIAGARAGENVSGGGVGLSGTDAYMTRCIVTNCQTSLTSGSTGPGGGVVADGGSRVDNCLIVDCKSQGVGGVLVRGDARLANCMVIDCATVVQGGDWHLTPASPYVNAGVNLDYTAESKDFEGNPRVFKFGLSSGKADIGLYESHWGSPGMLLLVR